MFKQVGSSFILPSIIFALFFCFFFAAPLFVAFYDTTTSPNEKVLFCGGWGLFWAITCVCIVYDVRKELKRDISFYEQEAVNLINAQRNIEGLPPVSCPRKHDKRGKVIYLKNNN